MKRTDIIAIAILVASMLRIASTWTIYSATVDEPMHVSTELELYTQQTNDYQPWNAPLPRIVLGLLPYVGGMDFDPSATDREQLLHVFHSDGQYDRNLILARSGNLVFFVIASMTVWWWARRDHGSAGGCIAMLLFTLQPMIAGHAGLATPDMAGAASIAASLFAFVRWLDVPTVRRAAVVGVAFGIAVLCKFSALGFVPVACAGMYLVRVRMDRNQRDAGKALLVVLLTSGAVVVAGYAFRIDWLITGFKGLAAIERQGMLSYLFGEVRETGFWSYFPVAVALKSTIAFLILVIAAFFTRRHRVIELLAASILILVVAMTSHLDLGVRYVLPIYAPLSVTAAAAALHFRRRWIPILLLSWHVAASAIAYPDAFPYFNELAQPRPWEYLVDSNIDWGQDVLRLRDVVRRKKIDRLGIAVMGWHDWNALQFPPTYVVERDVPSRGWIAVSEQMYAVGPRPCPCPWLKGRSYERVGKSIRLYYLP